MLFKAPGNPTGPKKAVYLLSATVLGVLLSFIIHALMEMIYLSGAAKQGVVAPFYNGCALPPWLQIALLLAGVGGGFWLGCVWWKMIYVDRRWMKRRRRK